MIFLFLLLAGVACAEVAPLYSTLNDLPGTALVMTNVAEYVAANGGSGGGAVQSVNGETGVVVLDAEKVGALPVDGVAQEANHAETANRANSAAYANEADNASYASSAGSVFWFDISGVPSWIGDDKPTYTADEVGALPITGGILSGNLAIGTIDNIFFNAERGTALIDGITCTTLSAYESIYVNDVDILNEVNSKAPAKTILTLGGTSPNYELRLNGVAQTFEQVSNYVANGEVIAKHLNGFYKPTYLSASEIMFDCTGFIAGDVSTRRIHMTKSNNKVALDDTKVLAEEKWVGTTVTNVVNDYVATNTEVFVTNNLLTISQDGAIKWQESFGGYKMDASTAQTVNCKDHAVTFVTASGETGLTIVPPGANANGESRDFVVYVNTSGTNSLDLTAFTTIYASDVANTNAVKEKLTALYFTELSADVWMLGRQELNRVKP